MFVHPTVLAYEVESRRCDSPQQRAAQPDAALPVRLLRLPLPRNGLRRTAPARRAA